MVTKKLWQMAVCAVLLLVVAACGKEDEDNIIWDIANFKIEIKVSNQQGQDITSQVASMAPEAVWKGKTYALKTKRTETNMSARTRALAVVFDGLFTENGRLYFGELSGSDTYKDEELIIKWPDGTQNVIKFCHELVWKDNEPIFNQSFQLDGKPVKSIVIIRR